jgi:hypothetical protein
MLDATETGTEDATETETEAGLQKLLLQTPLSLQCWANELPIFFRFACMACSLFWLSYIRESVAICTAMRSTVIRLTWCASCWKLSTVPQKQRCTALLTVIWCTFYRTSRYLFTALQFLQLLSCVKMHHVLHAAAKGRRRPFHRIKCTPLDNSSDAANSTMGNSPSRTYLTQAAQ